MLFLLMSLDNSFDQLSSFETKLKSFGLICLLFAKHQHTSEFTYEECFVSFGKLFLNLLHRQYVFL